MKSLHRSALLVALTGIGLIGPRIAAAQVTLSGQLTADNAFFAYLSSSANSLGTLIGSGNNWGQTYTLTPSTLTAGGRYFINIEVINYGAEASLIGDFELSSAAASFANGQQSLSTGVGNWLATYNDANSSVAPQPWVSPTGGVFDEGANGVNPWGPRSGISSTTQWIWPSDLGSSPSGLTQGGVCQYCTVDFQTEIQVAVPEPEPLRLSLASLGALTAVAWVTRRRRYLK